MKRIINFRPLFFCFVGLALGIRFARDIFELNPLIWSIFTVLFGLSLILCIIRFILNKKSITQEKKPWHLFFRGITCISIAFLIGISSYAWDYHRLSNNKVYSEEVVLEGRISEDIVKNSTSSVLLTNVKINGENAKNVMVYVWSNTYYETGSTLKIKTIPVNVSYYELKEFKNYYYKDNIGYICRATIGDNAEAIAGNRNILEAFRKSVKDVLDSEMNENSAQIAYSALFGDKSDMKDSTMQAFRDSGVAHLLAVSGLHVGFFTVLLSFVLSKLHIKRWYNFLVTAIVLFIYAMLCSFTPSVVRAGLMCLILLSANLFGKQYDTLTSLSLAGLIILFVRPLTVFDVGFQLSFFSVFAICLFAKPLQHLFEKIRMPKFLASSLSLTISAQVGITPIVARTFGTASLLSPLANILCIPIFELAYITLVLFLILGIIPFLRFLLSAPELLFKLVLEIASGISSVEGSILNLPYMEYTLVILFYVGLFMLSRFVMLKGQIKLSSFSALFAISFCFSLLELQRPYETSFSVVSSYNSTCQVITNTKGEVTVVVSSEKLNLDNLVAYLRLNHITNVNQIITFNSSNTKDFEIFEESYVNESQVETKIEDFKTLYDDKIYGKLIEVDDTRFVVTANKVSPSSSELLNLFEMTYYNEKFDVLWQNEDKGYNNFNNFKYTTSSKKTSTTNNYSIDEYGNFTMLFKDGKLQTVRSND